MSVVFGTVREHNQPSPLFFPMVLSRQRLGNLFLCADGQGRTRLRWRKKAKATLMSLAIRMAGPWPREGESTGGGLCEHP